MRRDFYVYVIFRLNGIPCYVGKGCGDRWTRHEQRPIHENRHFRSIIQQARTAGRELPKIKLHESLTEAIAFEYEKALIHAIGREHAGGPLVNLTDGGDGESGRVMSAEQKQKISARKKGRPYTDHQRAVHEAAMARPGVREKIKRSRQETLDAMTPEERKKFGHSGPSTEHIAYLAKLNRERDYPSRSEETRSKLSQSIKDWWAARKLAAQAADTSHQKGDCHV